VVEGCQGGAAHPAGQAGDEGDLACQVAGGPLPGEGQLVVPGMAGDHVAAVCCAADAVYRLGGESGRGW
jgi:hypothetical protein